jgi:hypothetical protein
MMIPQTIRAEDAAAELSRALGGRRSGRSWMARWRQRTRPPSATARPAGESASSRGMDANDVLRREASVA